MCWMSSSSSMSSTKRKSECCSSIFELDTAREDSLSKCLRGRHVPQETGQQLHRIAKTETADDLSGSVPVNPETQSIDPI